jgi:hypothetical protein
VAAYPSGASAGGGAAAGAAAAPAGTAAAAAPDPDDDDAPQIPTPASWRSAASGSPRRKRPADALSAAPYPLRLLADRKAALRSETIPKLDADWTALAEPAIDFRCALMRDCRGGHRLRQFPHMAKPSVNLLSPLDIDQEPDLVLTTAEMYPLACAICLRLVAAADNSESSMGFGAREIAVCKGCRIKYPFYPSYLVTELDPALNPRKTHLAHEGILAVSLKTIGRVRYEEPFLLSPIAHGATPVTGDMAGRVFIWKGDRIRGWLSSPVVTALPGLAPEPLGDVYETLQDQGVFLGDEQGHALLAEHLGVDLKKIQFRVYRPAAKGKP